MKSFKQFVREQTEQEIEQGVMNKSGVPNVVILKPSDEERQEQQRKEEASLSEDASVGKNAPSVASDSFKDWKASNPNEHLGKMVNDVHRNLTEKSSFSDADTEHINRYSKSSNTMNRMLYNKHGAGEAVPDTAPTKSGEDGVHHIPSLDKAISHPLTHDLHVMTGTRFNPGALAAQHPEGHLHLPAYTSMSISPVVAHQFATPQENNDLHVLHVHMKAGDKTRYVAPVSNFKHEKEAILPRNTTLKVHPTPTVHTDGSGSKVHVWHATVHSQS